MKKKPACWAFYRPAAPAAQQDKVTAVAAAFNVDRSFAAAVIEAIAPSRNWDTATVVDACVAFFD